MMHTRRILLLLLALVLLCTGCSLDVENYLHPPRVGGQQQAVQAALETYLRDSGAGVRYTMEYPVEGDHTAAFILCDAQGFPVTDPEDAATALAFYSLATFPDVTRMNRLQKVSGEWMSVADTVGEGTSIRQVAFGDLDGDATAEIITGWTTYSTGSYRLAVYSSEGGLTALSVDRLYSALYVGDLAAAGYDSLLLLSVASGDRVTASLESMEEGELTTVDTVSLDGGIRQFGSLTLCRLEERVHGLYVEGFKAEDVTVTELIYLDDTGLHAPFYDPAANATVVTSRGGRIPAQDIDGDGRVEIPYHTPLAGHSPARPGGAVTLWRGWDYATATWKDSWHTLLNEADGYMVVLEDDRHTHLSTAYDTATRTLSLADKATGRPWLWLTAGAAAPIEAPSNDLESLTLFPTEENSGFYAYYDPAVVGAERVRYMVVRLHGEGG